MGIIRRVWRTITSCVTCKKGRKVHFSIDEEVESFHNHDLEMESVLETLSTVPLQDSIVKVLSYLNDQSLWIDKEMESVHENESVPLQDSICKVLTWMNDHSLWNEKVNDTPEMESSLETVEEVSTVPLQDSILKVLSWLNDQSLWIDKEIDTEEMESVHSNESVPLQDSIFKVLAWMNDHSLWNEKVNETPEVVLHLLDLSYSHDKENSESSFQQSLGLNNDINSIIDEIISDVVHDSETSEMEFYLSELFDEVIYDAIARPRTINVEKALRTANIIHSALFLIGLFFD